MEDVGCWFSTECFGVESAVAPCRLGNVMTVMSVAALAIAVVVDGRSKPK